MKDRIQDDFSIIRNDCLAYPILAKANEESLRNGIFNEFDYELVVTVPSSYGVASSGNLLKIENRNQYLTYHYQAYQKTWCIDVCVRNYRLIEEE